MASRSALVVLVLLSSSPAAAQAPTSASVAGWPQALSAGWDLPPLAAWHLRRPSPSPSPSAAVEPVSPTLSTLPAPASASASPTPSSAPAPSSASASPSSAPALASATASAPAASFTSPAFPSAMPSTGSPTPTPSATALAVPSTSTSTKKGFVANTGGCGSPCNDGALLPGLPYYSYNPTDSYTSTDALLFTPMFHCTSQLGETIPSTFTSAQGAGLFVMTFNEPNNAGQCPLSGAAAAASWQQLQAANPSASLLAPATAYNGESWLASFFAACSGCRVAGIAAHIYQCDASEVMSYVDALFAAYSLPIWLTEFSCGDNAQAQPTSAHESFMRAVVPLLEASPAVTRFYWMAARDTSGRRNLVTGTGSAAALTPLGEVFLSL